MLEIEDIEPEIDSEMSRAIEEFTHELSKSVKNRAADVPYLEYVGGDINALQRETNELKLAQRDKRE
jgi:hypothetical protein